MIILLLSGCLQSGTNQSYDDVYVSYTITGGAVAADRHTTEYVVNNTVVSYRRLYPDGRVAYEKSASIDEERYRRFGKEVVELGVYGLLDEYSTASPVYSEHQPAATLEVSIDGKDKTILLKPYVEEHAPGGVQKIIFEVRDMTSGIQG